MSEPDLKLGGLSLWVRSRAIPEASDYWDGNWLDVRATMQVGLSSVTTSGAILMATDFASFRSQLSEMHRTLNGEAELSGYEPNLQVTLRSSSLGSIAGEVEITPDNLSEFHRFHVGLDQSYLPELIQACDAICERYPVLGQPDS